MKKCGYCPNNDNGSAFETRPRLWLVFIEISLGNPLGWYYSISIHRGSKQACVHGKYCQRSVSVCLTTLITISFRFKMKILEAKAYEHQEDCIRCYKISPDH